jgi:hypothetical protein
MAENPCKVGTERVLGPALQRGDRHLVDQLSEIGGLRQDLDVQKARDRLQRHGGELLAPMQPARRMDVANRHREDQLPGKAAQPPRQPAQEWHAPRADHVVTMVDRRQQRIEMRCGPRTTGRGYQNQRRGRSGKSAL